MKKLTSFLLCLALVFSLAACGNKAAPGTAAEASGSAAAEASAARSAAEDAESATGASDGAQLEDPEDPAPGYTLDRVVVLSRHNIRSPLSGSGSALEELTPHPWFAWTSNASELSLRGGHLETMMGQYFRLWLEQEGLFPENYRPEEGEVRIYANAKQRTIATARYFSAGLLPVGDVDIETHTAYDEMDPTFEPALHFLTAEYAEDIRSQVAELGGTEGMKGIQTALRPSIELLMDTADVNESEVYQSGKFGDLLEDETSLVLELGHEPAMNGPIKTATSLADALTLQYYEESDEEKAAFGHQLTREDWVQIHSIVDTYTEMLFTQPLVCVNVAHPLLQELRYELGAEHRKFSFLCGHDSNVASVLASLGAEEYSLPETVEPKTPIGVKLMFERRRDQAGQAWYRVSMVYRSTEQIRNADMLTLENPPMQYDLSFEGVETNEDGLIAEADLLALFDRSIAAMDALEDTYALADAA